MTVRVFHTDPALGGGSEVVLDGDESHYLVRVRRAVAGAELEVLDGHDGAWRAVVVSADPKAATVRIGDRVPQAPPGPQVELLLGLPDAKVTLDVLSRCCEVGVARVVLVACDRSQGGAPSATRISAVLQGAQRQCGRPSPPAVEGPVALREALARGDQVAGFFAWEGLRGAPTGASAPAVEGEMRLLVGPEGGLTDREVEHARESGLVALGLGPWTLRTGTAALYAVAWLMGAHGPP